METGERDERILGIDLPDIPLWAIWAIQQYAKSYGRDEAQTLIANTSVKCILRAGDAETAKSMEHGGWSMELFVQKLSFLQR